LGLRNWHWGTDVTKDKKTGVPDEVIRAIAEVEQQRAAYRENPDPLLVSTAVEEEQSVALSAEELLDECAAQPETDIGNGTRMLIRFGDRMRHVNNIGWHGYDGRRWLEDVSGAVVRQFAHRTAEFIDDEAIKLDCSPDEQAKIEAGRLAREAIKKMGKPGKEWTSEQLVEFERLQKDVDAMAKVEKDRSGRISSRHAHAKSAAGTSKIDNMLKESGGLFEVAWDSAAGSGGLM
jgi:putative DNA primase/helicase